MIGKPTITNYCITTMQCVQSVTGYGGTVYIVVATLSIDRTSALNLWMGGTDEVKEGDFVWTDGTHLLLNASVWLPGNPDNLYNEDCQHIFTAAVYRLTYSVRCDFLMPYLCQIDM